MSNDWQTKKLDAVYFVRDGENEELRYSLRSLAKNLPCRKVWIYGGKPEWANPDEFVRIDPDQTTSCYDRVQANLKRVALNPEITEDFILMNDDFFILKRTEELPPAHRGPLSAHIAKVEAKYGGAPTFFTEQLRQALEALGPGAKSYELHIPVILNRQKLLQTLQAHPGIHATRTLYGNQHGLAGSQIEDVKILPPGEFPKGGQFISSDDSTWGPTALTEYIRAEFPEPSKYEKNA